MLPAGKLVGLWFRRTRGRVMGITAMGNNFGGLVFPPHDGMDAPPHVVGGNLRCAWSHDSVPSWLFTMVAVRDSPSERDLERGASELEGRELTQVAGRTVGQALRDKSFYAIAVAVTLGTFTYSAIIPQIIPHLLDGGTTLAIASIVLSMYAIAGMVGKFIMGLVAERVTSRYALMLNFVGQAVFLLAMIRADNPMVMWTAVPILGIFNGAFGALFQLVVQDAFGIRYFGSIMGLINFATLVSFFFGPILAGLSYDITGSYTMAFLAVAGMFATAVLALTQARPRTDLT